MFQYLPHFYFNFVILIICLHFYHWIISHGECLMHYISLFNITSWYSWVSNRILYDSCYSMGLKNKIILSSIILSFIIKLLNQRFQTHQTLNFHFRSWYFFKIVFYSGFTLYNTQFSEQIWNTNISTYTDHLPVLFPRAFRVIILSSKSDDKKLENYPKNRINIFVSL